MRDFIIIVSSLGGVFVEEYTGNNPVWGSFRWYVKAHDESHAMRLDEYNIACEQAHDIKEGDVCYG